MPNHIENIVTFDGEERQIQEMLAQIQNDEFGIGSISFGKVIPMPENIYKSDLGTAERELYGKNNWYDWSISNWGTKWDAYGYDSEMDYSQNDHLWFQTAWAAPHPVLEKLSQMHPDVMFTHKWADEDLGQNCGRYEYADGERTEKYIPNTNKESLEFAASVWDYDLRDFDMVLNSTETDYINIEDEKYDLIELFGQPALYSGGRMKNTDIPQGLFKCDVRGDDETTGWFAGLSPHVLVNHFGTIITNEPLDFGEEGHIWLTEETEPNFMGNALTFGEFMRGEFEQEETQGIGEMNL